MKKKPIKLTSDGPEIMTSVPVDELMITWVQWIFYMFITWSPFYFHGIITAVIPWVWHGVAFYFLSQVSHNNEKSIFVNQKEWCVSQVQCASGDYENGPKANRFWMFFSVGLNYQAIHHLFPNIHWA